MINDDDDVVMMMLLLLLLLLLLMMKMIMMTITMMMIMMMTMMIISTLIMMTPFTEFTETVNQTLNNMANRVNQLRYRWFHSLPLSMLIVNKILL